MVYGAFMQAISLSSTFIMSMIGNCSIPMNDVWVLDKIFEIVVEITC